MPPDGDFASLFDADSSQSLDFLTEKLILDFTEAVALRMAQLQLSRADLALRLGVSPAFVTKLLQGKNNFTLKTMVKVAKALSATCEISVQPAASASNVKASPKRRATLAASASLPASEAAQPPGQSASAAGAHSACREQAGAHKGPQ